MSKSSNSTGSVRKKFWDRDDTELTLLALPTTVWYILFCFLPMIGIIIAFKDFKIHGSFLQSMIQSEWCMFDNFAFLFGTNKIWMILRNTILYNILFIILGIVLPVAATLMITMLHGKRLAKAYQTAMFMPYFLSWVVLALVIKNLFSLDGSINAMLGTSLNWLGSNSLFQPLLILTDTWKEFGYGSIVYLAAITSIDSTLYEAASIDGATWWKKVWHVTLPGIRTTIVLMAVMNLGNILNAGFDQVYNLYSASVYATGDILDTYVYRVGLQGLQYSFGTAVGLLKSVIAFVLMIGANKLAQKYTDSKIF